MPTYSEGLGSGAGVVCSGIEQTNAIYNVLPVFSKAYANLPGSVVNWSGAQSGTGIWTNTSNALTENGSYSSVDIDGAGEVNARWSQYLYASNFNFNIPSGTTVTGFSVRIKGYCSAFTEFSLVQLATSSTTAVGNNKANGEDLAGTNTNYFYGTAVDLWGTNLSTATINSSGFGVLVQVYTWNNFDIVTAYIDAIELTVYAEGGAITAGGKIDFAFDELANGGLLVNSESLTQARYNIQLGAPGNISAFPANVGTASWGVGFAAWSNSSNALTSNDSYATASVGDMLVNSQTTQTLVVTGFNFTIPQSASIIGITVGIEAKGDNSNVKITRVQLTKSGTGSVGDNKANNTYVSTSDVIYNFGGQQDLWNTTWSVAEVNSNTFGVGVEMTYSPVLEEFVTAYIDSIQIRIDYHAVGMGTVGGLAIQNSTRDVIPALGSVLAGTVVVNSQKDIAASGGIVPSGTAIDSYIVGSQTYSEIGSGGTQLVAATSDVFVISPLFTASGGSTAGSNSDLLIFFDVAATGNLLAAGLGFVDGIKTEYAEGGPITGGSGGLEGSKDVLVSGGIGITGDISPDAIYNVFSFGNSLFAGEAELTGQKDAPISGGIWAGSSAVLSVLYAQGTTGGVSLSGLGTTDVVRSLFVSGGVQSGSSADILYYATTEMVGACLVGSTATQATNADLYPDGGVIVGTNAIDFYNGNIFGDWGIAVAGLADITFIDYVDMEGGVEVSGFTRPMGLGDVEVDGGISIVPSDADVLFLSDNILADGSVQLGGIGQLGNTIDAILLGQVQLSGQSEITSVYHVIGQGEILASGFMEDLAGNNATSDGGSLGSGDGLIAAIYDCFCVGGILLGADGLVDSSNGFEIEASGLVISGEADTTRSLEPLESLGGVNVSWTTEEYVVTYSQGTVIAGGIIEIASSYDVWFVGQVYIAGEATVTVDLAMPEVLAGVVLSGSAVKSQRTHSVTIYRQPVSKC